MSPQTGTNSRKILEMIRAAVDLANSIHDDIKDRSNVSDETVRALDAFMRRHNELEELLDLIEDTLHNEEFGGGDPSGYN